jgi:hypothetical protein
MKLSRGSLVIILIALVILLLGMVQLVARGFMPAHASDFGVRHSGPAVKMLLRTR